ncbi:low-specificity L-threonine aldolase [Fluviicola taffensis]|uniref:Threonine aldolase n=1 Tax=Fluviicola taffensis (strain DSM 16823 / NCIMB 13979 / RW262) TaxID=755732 RepID=F2IHN2_FLUTR|nr:low-specificity L-threonine aldolase [Fluviicola taffensis]AEA44810.1 Threonine aldolase [Fluviicola taffensis DSM 16823]
MNSDFVDFRSDTVTKPSKEMLEAMFQASVGDDVYGEDPTVNELQDYVAQLFGMEAALFCASGTQTNQIAINIHVKPGGEVICHEESHVYKYEGGGIAKNSGASVRLLQGNRGRLKASEIEKWIMPDDIHFPVTQLISLEDTANRGGGAVYDFKEIQAIAQLAKSKNIPLHLDGARIFNALAVNGIDIKQYASQFDSISICLSKGLGAPVGSLLLGTKDFIHQARRVRKVMGGGMRQAGFLAAAGLYALKNNVIRLSEDHSKAKQLEDTCLKCSWIESTLGVETNILVVILKEESKRDFYIQKLAEVGVKVSAFGPGMIRFVTHLDLSQEQLDFTIEQLKKL